MFRSTGMRWRRVGAAGIVAFGVIAAVCISFLANGGSAHGTPAQKPWTLKATYSQGGSGRKVTLSQLPTTTSHTGPTQTLPHLGGVLAGPNSAYARNTQVGAFSATPATAARPGADFVGTSQIPLLYRNHAGLTANDGCGNGCEPPDQAIGVSNSYVVEGVNAAFAIYNTSLTKLAGPYSAASFFGTVQAGNFFSDPQITYDAERAVWLQSWLEITADKSYDWIDLAVSVAGSPYPGQYFIYHIGAPTGEFCDYDTLGYDYWDMWLTCVEFNSTGGFIGNRTFTFDLNTMIAGGSLGYWFWGNINTSQGCPSCLAAYRLSPAIEDGVPNAEWVTASDQCAGNSCGGNPSNNLTACSFTNTHYVATGVKPTDLCIFNNILLGYDDPILADQKGAPGTMFPGVGYKQIRYTGGHLYFAMPVKFGNCGGSTEDGIAWYEVTPRLNPYTGSPQTIAGVVQEQAGYWCFNGHVDAYMPTAVPSYEGDIALVYNYSSNVSSIAPTIGYTGRQEADAVGTMGQGGANAGVAGNINDNLTNRWGDYSACALTINSVTRGIAFCGGEFVGSDGFLWDTQLYALRMQ
jgi:hypothetical protein